MYYVFRYEGIELIEYVVVNIFMMIDICVNICFFLGFLGTSQRFGSPQNEFFGFLLDSCIGEGMFEFLCWSRLLAPCGKHSCLVAARCACIQTGRYSCIVVVTPMFFMIWALVRILPPCGKHS